MPGGSQARPEAAVADAVDDHVDSAVSQRLDLVGELRGRGVDRSDHALAGEEVVFRLRSRGVDLGARITRELHGCEADASRRGSDEHAIALSDARRLAHRGVRRQVVQRQSRSGGEVDVLGDEEHELLGDMTSCA